MQAHLRARALLRARGARALVTLARHSAGGVARDATPPFPLRSTPSG
jgi:hypothetical protein